MFDFKQVKKYMFSNRYEVLFLFLLFALSVFLRVTQLGFSDFYGDETKVLYLRKDTSASDFLLNQRKGPMQFIVAWGMETITGGYDEFLTRLPFSIAGVLSVFVLYYLIREFFGYRVAGVSALLFSLNGFFIAFSRTVQYQSFLILFGLLSVFFYVLFAKATCQNNFFHKPLGKFSAKSALAKNTFLLLSGVFLGLAYLSHWDAVFYDFLLGVLIIYFYKLTPNKKSYIKNILTYLIIPCVLVVSIFYFPYFTGGYYNENVGEYISKRYSGERQLPNSTIVTILTYNPTFLIYLVPIFAIYAFYVGLITERDHKVVITTLWFLAPAITFELIFANPGTHIQNYIIPLLVLTSLGIIYLYNALKNKVIAFTLYKSILSLSLILLLMVSSYVYVPFLNNGYPWKQSKIGPFDAYPLQKNSYQLFLYGFPYNRGWRDVKQTASDLGGFRSFYTNDNVTIGEYYLLGTSVHIPTDTQKPEYYINVINNQEFNNFNKILKNDSKLVKEIYNNGEVVAEIYKVENVDKVEKTEK